MGQTRLARGPALDNGEECGDSYETPMEAARMLPYARLCVCVCVCGGGGGGVWDYTEYPQLCHSSREVSNCLHISPISEAVWELSTVGISLNISYGPTRTTC
jgi:hypothetical protein